MSWIELFDGRSLGRYDLPTVLSSSDGDTFTLGPARKQGGNGVVFAAWRGRRQGEATCAIKLLKRLDSQRRDRFDNEVRILSRLSHKNISTYYGQGIFTPAADVEVPWVAMDLGERNLREHVDTNRALDPQLLVKVATQMCEAVEHIHAQDLLHRDIKPDNFVFAGSETVKMIDFGIAKYFGEDVSARPLDQFTQQSEFVGPAFYSSPELLAYARNKAHSVDQRSDLFQLAKVIWFLATGRVSGGIPARKLCPFRGMLWDGLITSFSDDPEDRPQSVGELRQIIEGLG